MLVSLLIGLAIASTVLLQLPIMIADVWGGSPCGAILSAKTEQGSPSTSTVGAPGPTTIPGPTIDIPTLPTPNINSC